MKIKFKDNFLLGSASAATQIEGGELDSNWMQFFKDGNVRDGSSPAKATEHWKYWKADNEIMVEMGMQIARVGLEWARIFPAENKIDETALQQYFEEVNFLQKNGIKVLLTIHHFSNPMWFEKKGGWLKFENVKYFLQLVQVVTERFYSIVSEYITINEPNVYATNSYFFGEWYPCHKSISETFAVMENMAYAHIKAYEMIHSARKSLGVSEIDKKDKTMVSFANHLRAFIPKNRFNPFHRFATYLSEYLFQSALSKAMTLGEFPFPLKNKGGVKKGVYVDFNALNYYSRSCVSGFADGAMHNSPRNDLDWEIYPRGIVECAEKMYALVAKPIWITENGTCDNEDKFRSRYIYEHLAEIVKSNLPIDRYYHWCFIDNWEWKEGEKPRFGLVHNDYATQKRTIKTSGKFFSKMILEQGVTEEMYNEFVKEQVYKIK